MNLLAALLMITGTITFDDTPLINQEILLVDPISNQIVAGGITTEQGTYSIEIPDEYDKKTIVVLAKINSKEVVALEMEAFELQRENTIDFNLKSSDYQLVQGKIKQELGYPETFDLLVVPAEANNLPIKLNGLAKTNLKGQMAPFYFKRTINPKSFSFYAKSGTYDVAGHLQRERPISVDFEGVSKEDNLRMQQLQNANFKLSTIEVVSLDGKEETLNAEPFILKVVRGCTLNIQVQTTER